MARTYDKPTRDQLRSWYAQCLPGFYFLDLTRGSRGAVKHSYPSSKYRLLILSELALPTHADYDLFGSLFKIACLDSLGHTSCRILISSFVHALHFQLPKYTPFCLITGLPSSIFIDGCFWHGCSKCYKEPTSNIGFWRAKLNRNIQRRSIISRRLMEDGWKVFEFWEHEILSNPSKVARKIRRFI